MRRSPAILRPGAQARLPGVPNDGDQSVFARFVAQSQRTLQGAGANGAREPVTRIDARVVGYGARV